MIGDEAHYHLMRRAYSLLIPAAAFLYMKVGSHGARGDYPRRREIRRLLDFDRPAKIAVTVCSLK